MSPSIPTALLRVLHCSLRPDRFDEKDPARRKFSGSQNDVDFWLKKSNPDSLGRYLHLKKLGKQSFYLAVHWVDPEHEWVRTRGDFNELYGGLKGIPVELVVQLWRELCRVLLPFHAFLDTLDQYNRRAHKVLPDGSISKTRGWYSERLPGLFAHNYFGDVYLRQWGTRVRNLPAGLTTADANGLFVTAPSGLDLEGRMSEVYSPEDLAVIQVLGPEWFHLPGHADQVHAPSLDEFMAATPRLD
jgi:hypothetical protein